MLKPHSNAIGYASLEEWEANTPNRFPGPPEPRSEMPIYLTLTSRKEGGSPATLRSTLKVQRLDESGDLHYWQLHVCSLATFDGVTPMFETERPILASGRVVYDVVAAWLNAKGFKHIANAQVAVHKDYSLLDGHTDLLRYVQDIGWTTREPAVAA